MNPIDLLKDVGEVFRLYPVAAIELIALGGVVCYLFVKIRLANAHAVHEALREQMKTMEDRLAWKDEAVAQYRKLATHVEGAEATLTKVSDRELRERALSLASGIRTLGQTYNRRSQEAFEEARHLPAGRDWEVMTRRSGKLLAEAIEEYSRRYKAEALVTRDEALSRLGPTPQRGEQFGLVPTFYELPTNALGLDAVATDLEVLARQLAAA